MKKLQNANLSAVETQRYTSSNYTEIAAYQSDTITVEYPNIVFLTVQANQTLIEGDFELEYSIEKYKPPPQQSFFETKNFLYIVGAVGGAGILVLMLLLCLCCCLCKKRQLER